MWSDSDWRLTLSLRGGRDSPQIKVASKFVLLQWHSEQIMRVCLTSSFWSRRQHLNVKEHLRNRSRWLAILRTQHDTPVFTGHSGLCYNPLLLRVPQPLNTNQPAPLSASFNPATHSPSWLEQSANSACLAHSSSVPALQPLPFTGSRSS